MFDSRACRHRKSVAFPLLAALAAAPGPAHAAMPAPPAGLVTATPLPRSQFVSANTRVLLRFTLPSDPAPAGGHTVAVRGSLSGLHSGQLESLEQGRLIRFTPDAPFAAGEGVTVEYADMLAPSDSASFTFGVAYSQPEVPAWTLGLPRGATPAGTLPGDPGGGSDSPPDSPPPGPPKITYTQTGPVAPGELYLASFPVGHAASSYLMVLGDKANPMFVREMPVPCYDFKRHWNGRISLYNSATHQFDLMNDSYQVEGHLQCDNGYIADLHELRFLPNGHALLMSYDPEPVDMSAIVPGGNPHATVTGLVIQELDEGGRAVFQWRSWDHLAITDATHEDLTAASIDYVHGNALEVDGDGNLLLSSRHMDTIFKIDRATGEILWRLGGMHNDFTFLGDTLQFSHQHAVRRLDNGHITLFDNGDFHTPQFSRAAEYELDEAARTARLVWQFRMAPDTYGSAMGFVQRLANGNTLVSWGTGKPDAVEVAPDGAVVMTLEMPSGIYTYRVFRVPPAGTGTPPVSTSPRLETLSANRPNPFVGSTNVIVGVPGASRVSLRVYDLAGRLVRSVLDDVPRESGVYVEHVDLHGQPPGVYFCRLTVGSKVLTRTMTLAR